MILRKGHACTPLLQADLRVTRERRFSEAIRAGRISKVEQISECCILAAVGQQMASRKGVAATMFSALAKANINIRCALPLDSSSLSVHINLTGSNDPQSCLSLCKGLPVSLIASLVRLMTRVCQGE